MRVLRVICSHRLTPPAELWIRECHAAVCPRCGKCRDSTGAWLPLAAIGEAHLFPLTELASYYGYGARTLAPYVLPPEGHPWRGLYPLQSAYMKEAEGFECPRSNGGAVDPAGGLCKLCNGTGLVYQEVADG